MIHRRTNLLRSCQTICQRIQDQRCSNCEGSQSTTAGCFCETNLGIPEKERQMKFPSIHGNERTNSVPRPHHSNILRSIRVRDKNASERRRYACQSLSSQKKVCGPEKRALNINKRGIHKLTLQLLWYMARTRNKK